MPRKRGGGGRAGPPWPEQLEPLPEGGKTDTFLTTTMVVAITDEVGRMIRIDFMTLVAGAALDQQITLVVAGRQF